VRRQGQIKTKRPTLTFQELGEKWTDESLHKDFPDYVKTKRSKDLDKGRLEVLYKTIGSVPLNEFKLEDAERAMAALDPELSSATRRQYAQLISKVLRLAVYPCKVIERSPLPLGFLPAVHGARVTAYLYPDEDRAVLGWSEQRARGEKNQESRPSVPLAYRVVYGFLAREGLRLCEALGLRWKDVDVKRGVVTLDANKTDDPRAWALTPGVAQALSSSSRTKPADWLVFGSIPENRAAETFRLHLGAAGVDRAELFAETDARRPSRARSTVIRAMVFASAETVASVFTAYARRSSRSHARTARASRGLLTAPAIDRA